MELPQFVQTHPESISSVLVCVMQLTIRFLEEVVELYINNDEGGAEEDNFSLDLYDILNSNNDVNNYNCVEYYSNEELV